MCKECFFSVFEEEIHRTIINGNLFTAGDRVAIGASGGKGDYYFKCFIFFNDKKVILLSKLYFNKCVVHLHRLHSIR